jgi:opacity protein-like surface antigen
MRNQARCTFVLLITSFALTPGAFAQEGEGETSDYARTGFYVGAGGVVAVPQNWDRDFNDDLNEQGSNLANQNAQAALNIAVLPALNQSIQESMVTIDGADLEATLVGATAVMGYRIGERLAFELEGEFLSGSNKTKLDAQIRSEYADGSVIQEDSVGDHSAVIEEIWAITANAKVYPPLTGRFQPFGKVGLGLQHAKHSVSIATSGFIANDVLVSTNYPDVPADFVINEKYTKLDGLFRVGAGLDVYATRNIVSELNFNFVIPFAEVGSIGLDYVAIQWRLLYRF